MKILSTQKSILPNGAIVAYREALQAKKPMTIQAWMKYIHKAASPKYKTAILAMWILSSCSSKQAHPTMNQVAEHINVKIDSLIKVSQKGAKDCQIKPCSCEELMTVKSNINQAEYLNNVVKYIISKP